VVKEGLLPYAFLCLLIKTDGMKCYVVKGGGVSEALEKGQPKKTKHGKLNTSILIRERLGLQAVASRKKGVEGKAVC